MSLLLPTAFLWSSARAQQVVDPGFLSARIYQPALVTVARQLGSGTRVIAGAIRRADGQDANKLVSYLPGGLADATFAANVANNQWEPGFVAEAAGGQLLVGSVYPTAMLVSGQVRRTLARLNPDGTLDTGFSLGTGLNGNLYALLVQPDGKIVLGGSFTNVAGQPAGNLIRLNADGTPDDDFLAAGPGCDGEVRSCLS